MYQLKTFQTNIQISLIEIFITFFKLGITSFGGPAMILYIRELAVEKRKWIDDLTFKNGVALCQVIPGATAMQMSAFVGLKTHGISGAIISFLGFGLPAFIIMLAFSILYQKTHNITQLVSIFNGLQVIIIAIIANAVITFGKNSIENWENALIAFISAILFFFGISPIVAILLSAIMGILLLNRKNETLTQKHIQKTSPQIKFLIIILLIIIISLIILYCLDKDLFNLSFLMLRIDLFAFGGGFASIPLMYHEIVNAHSWVDKETFLNGIALGQVTPGPIVITATFIGYIIKGWICYPRQIMNHPRG